MTCFASVWPGPMLENLSVGRRLARRWAANEECSTLAALGRALLDGTEIDLAFEVQFGDALVALRRLPDSPPYDEIRAAIVAVSDAMRAEDPEGFEAWHANRYDDWPAWSGRTYGARGAA